MVEEFGLEMESLEHEALTGTPRPPSQMKVGLSRPPKQDSRWKMIAAGCTAIFFIVWLLNSGGVDQNTVVTNIDDLPEAEDEVDPRLEEGSPMVEVDVPDAPEEDVNKAPEIKVPDAPVYTAVPRTIELQKSEKKGYVHHPNYFNTAYVRRARHDRTNLDSLAKAWGSWNLIDEKQRPDLTKKYEDYDNRDIPRDAFPADAWQVDVEYLQKFLPEAIALCERAMEAILAEYGHFDRGTSHLDDAMVGDEKGDPAYMFNMSFVGPEDKVNLKHPSGNAGYTTHNTWKRIRRQLLHSIMTEDKFFLTMGGHSSAAGHGNHFAQSYTLQTQRVLEPILARLGVFHISRNMGMGGLGTAHNALGMHDIYGGDNSLLHWDSGMTEKGKQQRDLFTRQGVFSGPRAPVILGEPVNYEKLAGAGRWYTGFWGAGMDGIPTTASPKDLDELPYATLFLDCSKEMGGECRKKGYNGVCWIEREDHEAHMQLKTMGGRAKWHPGNWNHQHTSRLTSYNIIKILREALLDWKNVYNYSLPEDEYFVTEESNRIRDAVRGEENDWCFGLGLPEDVCRIRFHGRSEMTPRAYPRETSIRSILREDVEVNDPPPNEYDPPDVYNPAFDPPDGAIDYLAIVENGVDFVPMRSRYEYLQRLLNPPAAPVREKSSLPGGKGWALMTCGAADSCDGTIDSFCNKAHGQTCLLYGHNDNRGGIAGDALSGWLLMNLPGVEKGYIMILLTKSSAYSNDRTYGWACENNGVLCDNQLSEEESKHLEDAKAECNEFVIEIAVDGVVKTIPGQEFLEQRINVERLIDITVVQTADTRPESQGDVVELGLRVTGNCGRAAVVKLSHVYWA